MYNLREYSKDYWKTLGSLWNFYRDEPNSYIDDNEIKYSIINSKYFDWKANFIGNVTHNNLTKKYIKIVVPLKYLSNFWRSLNMPLTNCEVELILTWFEIWNLLFPSLSKFAVKLICWIVLGSPSSACCLLNLLQSFCNNFKVDIV